MIKFNTVQMVNLRGRDSTKANTNLHDDAVTNFLRKLIITDTISQVQNNFKQEDPVFIIFFNVTSSFMWLSTLWYSYLLFCYLDQPSNSSKTLRSYFHEN